MKKLIKQIADIIIGVFKMFKNAIKKIREFEESLKRVKKIIENQEKSEKKAIEKANSLFKKLNHENN